MIKVVFVCLGNICRSPMAEAVFRHLVAEEGLNDQIEVDSAGTSDWHIGKVPHEGTLGILSKYNVSSENMHARQYVLDDLKKFDYIIAMDESNLHNMETIQKEIGSNKVCLLLDLIDTTEFKDVPDPYHTGDFEETYALVTAGSKALLERIKQENNLR